MAAAPESGSSGFSSRDAPAAKMRYFNPMARTEEGFIPFGEPAGVSKEEFRGRRHEITEAYQVPVVDARATPGGGLSAWSLDRHGFCYVKAPEPVDFSDRKSIKTDYYPRIIQSVLAATGASRAIVFSHLLRTENPPNFTAAYAGFAHLDYGPKHEEQWRALLVKRYGVPEEEAKSAGLCALNMWHPFDRPAYKNPLCYLDYTSVDMQKDTVPYRYLGNPTFERKTSREKTEKVYRDALGVFYSASHRWVFASDMRPDEAVLFKQYDTRPNLAKCAFHSSFADNYHENWKDCPERRSFESRILLVFTQKVGPGPGPGPGGGGGGTLEISRL